MPTRRLVVALAVLLFGTLGVGVVTAVRRSGEPASPAALPTPSTALDSPTPEPTATDVSPEPSPEPTEPAPSEPAPTGTPAAQPTSSAPPAPHMPSTGGPAALPMLALALAGAAAVLRRGARPTP